MNIKKITYRLTLIFCLLFATAMNAQGPGLEDDDVKDVPIDNWIPFMVVLAIGLVFYYTSKRKTITE